MNGLTKPRFSWLHTLVTGLFLFGLGFALVPWSAGLAGKGQQTKSINNCRQIIDACRKYAADHDGKYPDSALPKALDSNAVFHELFIGDAIMDERIFGSPYSPFQPDGDIGRGPDYPRALQPGENHWAMTKGLDIRSPGAIPFVYENPIESTWPPLWNAGVFHKPFKGRVWSGAKVIIGTNDGSVELMKLSVKEGRATIKSFEAGKEPGDLFLQWKRADGSAYHVLDVAMPK